MDKNLKNYRKFQKQTINLYYKTFGDLKEIKEPKEYFRNIIFGEGAKGFEKNLNNKEIIILRIFRGFQEISTSYERLLDTVIYIRQFPKYRKFRDRTITRSKYIRYHIEKYLEEINLIINRLKGYLNYIRKSYGKNTKEFELAKLTQVFIKNTLGELNKFRDTHVHEERYSDKDLERIDAIELLCELNILDEDFEKYLNKFVYPEVRKKWVRMVDGINKMVGGLMNEYFGAVYKLVFSKRGNIKLKR